MRQAGRITDQARQAAARLIRPGVTTQEIDRAVRRTIEQAGATPSFLGYGGFPGSACISINDEVIHGIPSPKRVLREGDIVSVDVGACYKGYHGDCADTFPVGEVSEEDQRLIEVTRQSFYEGIQFAREGYRISDISCAVQAYVEKHGFSVGARLCRARSVGRSLHEAPEVPNFGRPGQWRPAQGGHGAGRGAHGQRRRLRRPHSAGQVDGQNRRWQTLGPL